MPTGLIIRITWIEIWDSATIQPISMIQLTGSLKENKMIDFYCIIPARAGSKRIVNKNIQLVGNKPLVTHVIENTLASGVFKTVFVSTDSEQIAQIATSSGASVPELRAKDLSNDFTPTRPVIADFIMRHQELQRDNVVICCIYPFAILVSPQTIRNAGQLVTKMELGDKYLVSVRRYSHPIQRGLLKTQDGTLSPINPEYLEKRTQDLPATFHDAGQFYFAFASTWTVDTPVLANAFGFELGKFSSVDVDNTEDLEELRNIYAIKQIERATS